jgi:glycosyltransferase involved in cell wall biosynthesis
MTDGALRKRLKKAIMAADGVHIHGIWETHSMIAPGIARSSKRPYIISAHGMLDPWALRSKRVKKALYAALIEIRAMQRAACLRALTVDEVNDYRRLGLTNPIAIVPSGTQVQSDAKADLFYERYPSLAGKRIVLFMGRLNHKKGLQLLLQAWKRATVRTDDAHLVIAGPDSDQLLGSLEQLTDHLDIRSSVTFAGMLTSERKWSTLAAAQLFVLPSYSEGFSIAVLEALGMGVPALVSKPCHIPEVATYECGWVIDPELEQLQSALEEFLALPQQEAANLGARGRDLVFDRFRWSVVGRQMAQVYEWLQGGSKPTEVEIV